MTYPIRLADDPDVVVTWTIRCAFCGSHRCVLPCPWWGPLWQRKSRLKALRMKALNRS